MRIRATVVSGLTLALVSGAANAHIGVSSGPGFADTNQLVTFSVGHGCEGSDTQSVRIEIPAQVVSVRAVNSNLGSAAVETDDAGLVTAVTWSKPDSEVLDTDVNFYSLTLRIKVPNQPFETLYFPAYQTCRSADGDTIEVAWTAALPEDEAPMGEDPAPALTILPARVSGWNKFSVPADVEDLSAFFADALIVWKGDAAYSSNAATAESISNTPGVTTLTALEADDEIWVKY